MAPSLSRIEREPVQESQAVMSNNNSNNRDEVPPRAASVREHQEVGPSTNNGPDQHVNDDAQHNTSPGPSDVHVQGEETQVATAGRRSNTLGTNQPPVAAGATATAASQSGQEGHPLPAAAPDNNQAQAQPSPLDLCTRMLQLSQSIRDETRRQTDAIFQSTEAQVQALQSLGTRMTTVEDTQEKASEKLEEVVATVQKANEKLEEVVVATVQEQLQGVLKQACKLARRAVKKEHIKIKKEEGMPTGKRSLYNYHTQAEHLRLKGRNMSFADKAKEIGQTWKDMSDEERERRYGPLVEQDKERFLEESKKWEEIKESKLSLDERKPAAESSPQEPGHEELAATTEATNDPEDPTTAVGSPQEADPDNYQPSEYEQLREANIARNNERLIRLGLAQGGTTATAAEPAQAAGLPRESSSTGAHEGAAANLTRNDTSAVTDVRLVRAEINQEVNRAGSARAAEPPRESNQEVATSVAAAATAVAVNPNEDGNDQLSSPSETNKEGGKRKREHERGALCSYGPYRFVHELKGYSDPDGAVLEVGNVWVEFHPTGEIKQVKSNQLGKKPEGRLRPRRPRHNLLSGENVMFNVGDTFRCKLPSSINHSSSRVRCWAKVTKVAADGKLEVQSESAVFSSLFWCHTNLIPPNLLICIESGDVNSPNSKRHCHYIVDGRKISESTLSLKSISKRKV